MFIDSSFFSTIYGSTVSVFSYAKLACDLMTATLFYSGTGPANAIVQMTTVESWLALKDCTGAGCEPISPTYTAATVYPWDLCALEWKAARTADWYQ